MIVVLLLVETQVEFGVLCTDLLCSRPEEDHDAVLKIVIELDGVRVEVLTIKVVNPVQMMNRTAKKMNDDTLTPSRVYLLGSR